MNDKVNLAIDKIKNQVPNDINIIIVNNQSQNTKEQVSTLENSIFSGVILVVLVLSNKTNTIAYINKSEEDLAYKEIKGKYYIYAYSSSYKEDVIQFKSVYKKPSWIKNPY